MTIEEAEYLLSHMDDRKALVCKAFEAGVNKYRIWKLTGIARTTIDRWLDDWYEAKR